MDTATEQTTPQNSGPDQAKALADLRKAADKMEAWHERRDALVIAARESGASLRQIGSAAGMSAPGVNRIVIDGPYRAGQGTA